MLFLAQVKTAALITAACVAVAGTGVVVAQRATPTPVAAPAQVGVPPSGGAVTPSPLAPPKGGTPTAPTTVAADYKPGKLTAGVIVGVTDGKQLFRVKLDQPFNDLAEIGVRCCSPPAVILLDGQPATFAVAVVAGRRVEFEHVRGPTPYLSVRSATEQRLRFTEADNGKTVTVKLGQSFEVLLLNGREGAGWEPAATEITGASVERVNKLRRGNCDEFMAEKAPTPDTTLGMYTYRYNAVKIGTSIIRLYHLIPSGPVPKARDATGSLGEFKLIVEVTADGAAAVPAVNEHQAQQLAQLWVTSLLQGRLDQVLAISEVPFGWDKVVVVKTDEELKAKLEAVVQNKGFRNLIAGEAVLLKDKAEAEATEWFKQMDPDGRVFVTVVVETAEGKKAGITVAIKPGNQLKVVGFAD